MELLSLDGVLFNHLSTPSNNEMVITLGKYVNGKFTDAALACSLIVLIERSTIGTCSPREQI